MTTVTCADCRRSIFDLSPNDEAFSGLREVNSVLKEAVNSSDPASDGVYEALVSVVNLILQILLKSF